VQRLLASGQVSVVDVSCPWYEPSDPNQQTIRRALLGELLDEIGNA
jgi:hypothetical protein